MTHTERFTNTELTFIMEQGMRKLREAPLYQQGCLANPENDSLVHTTIATSVIKAHEIFAALRGRGHYFVKMGLGGVRDACLPV